MSLIRVKVLLEKCQLANELSVDKINCDSNTLLIGLRELSSPKKELTLSVNPTKWSSTLKQFIGNCWRIV